MITIRQAAPEERALIIRSLSTFTGPIPKKFHLTYQEVCELCGIDYRAEAAAAEKEHREWLLFAQESMRRILERDGDTDE